MYIYIPGMEQMLTISCFQDNSDNALSSLLRWGKNYIRVLLSHKQQVATGPFGLLCMCVKSLLSCLILCDLMGYSLQPRSMGFSRQEYWSGLPCPPLGDLPDPGIEPVSITSPALAGRLFTTRATWEAHWVPRWPQLGKSEAMKVKIKTEIESTKCVPLAEQYWTKLWLSHFDFEGFFLRPTLQDPWFPQDVLSHCDLLT